MQSRQELRSGLFFDAVVVVIAICFLWIPEYLPMIDLPQHAAQVSLFVELIKGQSSFSDIVEINYLTPYWIGYGPLALLTCFFDISVAVKLFASIVLVAFYSSVRQFFESINTPPQLAILTLPSFFGFSFEWGFLTFIAAVPVGFFYLSYVIKNSTRADGFLFLLKLFFFGFLLFFSHALVFVFFVAAGFLYQITRKAECKDMTIFPFVFPYVFFFLLLLAFVLRADPLLGMFSYGDGFFNYSSGNNRIIQILTFPWTMVTEARIFAFSAILMSIPFLFGCTLSKDVAKYVLFLLFVVVWFSLPHSFNKVFFIYERYSILAVVLYFSVFEEVAGKNEGFLATARGYVFPVLAILLMYKPLLDLYLFKHESKEFEIFIEGLDSNKRVLSLVFDKESYSLSNPFVYLHFPLWYQAEKQGFVDFNFAWFSPQVVRFNVDMAPEVRPSFEWLPHEFNTIKNCLTYDALIVRYTRPGLPKKISFGDCNFTYRQHHGSWFYYVRYTNN